MSRGNCTVCDSPNAANFHFGAHACKACAAFFRRSVKMQQIYECSGSSEQMCEINHALRLNCRQCRFTKCLQAGMQEELVQGTRDNNLSRVLVRQKKTPVPEEPVPSQSSSAVYYDRSTPELVFDPPSEWEYEPEKKVLKTSEDLMELDELQQFIQLPAPTIPVDMSRSIDEMDADEEDRLYTLSALYFDQMVNLNMRRRLTYTEKQLATMFDGPCHCPYEKADLKPFDHRLYRQKNRNEYTMILDYVNRFPDFHLLNKSEKNVLFRTASAVDILIEQAYYSQVLYPNESVLVTIKGEYLPMDPLPEPENEEDSFQKALILMLRKQWQHVVMPLKNLKMSLTEFALFKALTIWHYNYYKLQDTGRQISARQRDEIFRTLLVICKDEGHDDALLRVSELVLAVGIVMAEVHEMITSFIEVMIFDDVDDPILKDMLKFQY